MLHLLLGKEVSAGEWIFLFFMVSKIFVAIVYHSIWVRVLLIADELQKVSVSHPSFIANCIESNRCEDGLALWDFLEDFRCDTIVEGNLGDIVACDGLRVRLEVKHGRLVIGLEVHLLVLLKIVKLDPILPVNVLMAIRIWSVSPAFIHF